MTSKSSESGAASQPEGRDPFQDPYSRFLNKRELAKFLGKHPNTIDYLRAKRVIPFFRIGGSVMFRLREVERALERYRVKEVSL